MEDPDPDPNTIKFIIAYALLLLFGFMVTLGTSAIRKANEKKLRDAADDGDKIARRLSRLIDKRPRPADIAGVCTALTAMLVSAFAMLQFFNNLFGWFIRTLDVTLSDGFFVKAVSVVAPTLIITVVSTAVFSIISVLLPHRIGSQNCDKVSAALSGFLVFIKVVTFPVVWPVSTIARFLLKIFGGNPHIDETPVTEDEILSMVDEGEETGVLEESQKEMINNIFEFNDLTAGDVMTHRTDITAVEVSDNLNEAVKKAIEEGCSRIPVYEDELDNIKGILYVKDLLKYVGTAIPENLTPADLMREAMFIPETKNCRDLFSEMTEKHLQMVIVADEYGGVAGIVTVEDIIESIMGNIQDEFDDEQEDFEQISEDIFNIDGTSIISEVEELLDIEFPEGEYDTVAGYIMSVLGRIPDADEHPTLEYGGFSFTIEEMEDRRIVRIRVERLPEPEEQAD